MQNARHTYLQYFRLGDTAFREKVRFYEENPEALSTLYFDEKIDIDMDYLICLFEVGRYERFLEKVDPVIEIIIEENIFEFRNENIFNDLLLKKAACYYHTNQFEKANVILKQLIKIAPKHPLAIGLYGICKRKQNNDLATTIKALGIAALLLVVSISIIQILLFEPFFDEYMAPFLVLRTMLTVFSTLSFVSLEVYFLTSIFKETGRFPIAFLNRLFRIDKKK